MKRPSPALESVYEQKVLSEAVGATSGMKLSHRARVNEYSLRVYTHQQRVLWLLFHDKDLAGTGRLYIAGPAFTPPVPRDRWHAQVGIAVIAPEYRRRGLYTEVLKVLRKKLAMPIESDTSMTAGAIFAWKRAGGKLTDRQGDKVFRINPRSIVDSWWAPRYAARP